MKFSVGMLAALILGLTVFGIPQVAEASGTYRVTTVTHCSMGYCVRTQTVYQWNGTGWVIVSQSSETYKQSDAEIHQ